MKRTGIRRGPGNPIPPESRRAVERRDRDTCPRCYGPGAEWHHRRGRAVQDLHQHCACNGVMLCNTCHRWAHGHPIEAKAVGFVVRRDEPQPHVVPQRRLDGWWRLHCDGHAEPLLDVQVVMRAGAPALA